MPSPPSAGHGAEASPVLSCTLHAGNELHLIQSSQMRGLRLRDMKKWTISLRGASNPLIALSSKSKVLSASRTPSNFILGLCPSLSLLQPCQFSVLQKHPHFLLTPGPLHVLSRISSMLFLQPTFRLVNTVASFKPQLECPCFGEAFSDPPDLVRAPAKILKANLVFSFFF